MLRWVGFLAVLTLFLAIVSPNAAAQSHWVTLTWQPAQEPTDITLTGFNVYRATDSSGPYSAVGNVSAGTTVFTDNSVTAGSVYVYVVTSVDSAGVESAYSTDAEVTVPGSANTALSQTVSQISQNVSQAVSSVVSTVQSAQSATQTVLSTPASMPASATAQSLTSAVVTNSIVSAPAATPPPAPTSLPDGLLLRWTLDDSDVSGNVVSDLSGNGFSGFLYGNASPVAGKLNDALTFNGSNSYIAAPGGVATFASSLTLAVWVNTTNTYDTEALFSNFDAGGTAAGYLFTVDQGGHLDLRLGGADVLAYPNFLVDPTVINDGNWHHVAVTISFEQQTVTFYVDGQPTSQSAVNLFPGGDGGSFLEVGVNPYMPYGDYFTGAMEDVQVYARALSAPEVNTVYRVGGGR